jgi:superfamily II DNA or RNA helicase
MKTLQLPPSEFDGEYTKLITAYNELPFLHQTVVHILAVIYEQTARSHIVNSLKKLSIDYIGVKKITTGSLDPILDELVHQGLAERIDIRFQCARFLMEPICGLLVVQNRFDEIAAAVQHALPVSTWQNNLYYLTYEQIVREVRIGLYRSDVDYVHTLLQCFEKHHSFRIMDEHPYVAIFKHSLPINWISKNLPRELQSDIAATLADNALHHCQPVSQVFSTFLTTCLEAMDTADKREIIRTLLAEQLILKGRLKAAEQMVSGKDGMAATLLIRGFSDFLRGKNPEAITSYEVALALLKKTTRKRKVFFNTLSGLFYILALLKSGTPREVESAKNYAIIATTTLDYRFRIAFNALHGLIAAKAGNLPDPQESKLAWRETPLHAFDPFTGLIKALVLYWTDKRRAAKTKEMLKQLNNKAEQYGYDWLAAEYSVLLSRLSTDDAADAEKSASFFAASGIKSIVDLFQPESKWQQALNALITLKQGKSAAVETEKASRMVWLLDLSEKYGYWDLSPQEQVKTAKGVWSKGRRIALKRIYHEIDTFDFLTPQDKAVCQCLEQTSAVYRGYPDISYHFNARAIIALTGHPLVFPLDSSDTPIEIIKGRPELLINRGNDGGFEISFTPDLKTEKDVQLIRESPTRIRVIETGEDVMRIARIVGKALKVPASGKTQLLEAVNSVSGFLTVHSQIDGIGQEAEETLADPTPTIHLRPFGPGLKLDLRVLPFAAGGPAFRPGEGGETVISDINGKLFRTKRDLSREKAAANSVLSACPLLCSLGESREAMWEWELADPQNGLEVLLELKAIEESVILKWPEGEPFRIRQQADMKRFFMSVERQRDWFSVSGELRLDDGLVLTMEKLLSLLENTPGRFVRLDDGQFLALTKAFRKRLDEVAAYSKKSGETRRFHPLAALSLEDLAGELGGFEGDTHWKTHLSRLNVARSLKPEIPSTFQAELREYQMEGFRWLARLSHWGVGACLADDMGLGKTLQALAVILTSAGKGPSLVVAPTSVCMNWETEANRFAPSLTLITLTNGDREETLKRLKAFDLLLVSYGLLQQEKVAEMLSRVHFKTIVLDEAQAIKNLTTKRSQAAMNLDGDFKLVTTGTPIENHLGELWNLFRFINPGFLGSFEDFNKTFAVPIERNQDRGARQRLKKLVQPFILRRTKNQVLEELPPRTDILLQVELSTEELSFYEALRRKALETLTGEEAPSKNMHLRILAEIMKLRRACCNTRLVMPDIALPSAKLSVFGEIVEELLANGHKALVFSQFTGHLDIIRDYVEKKTIPYQYLDGSTPQKERKKRVEAFQGGVGDLFLISLKAGGLGLNLTAADYVIHMDPWWNPAVEDQASDRAHRIGQERPVTVYSLVARHTIEEKIVGLHKTKRALADSLLDGADMSGKMTADDLLRLIREH